MPDNDIILLDQSTTPISFKPRSKDRGGNVREFVHGLSNQNGTQVNPATEDTLGSILTSLNLVNKESSQQSIVTSLSSLLTATGLNNREITQQLVLNSLGLVNKETTQQSILTALSLISKETSQQTSITALGNILTGITTLTSEIGSLTENAPSTDTGSSGINGRLQRVNQRLTALIALLPTALSNGSLKVDTVMQTTSVNKSGTITSGGSSQVLMPANPTRRGFSLQNQSTDDLFVNGVSGATLDQNSLRISAGDYFETTSYHVGTGIVSIVGPTTGQPFYARES